MIITELKPDLVIELGTNMGGGALYLADLMEMMGHGRIHTIDIEDKAYNDLMRDHPRIERFVDGWENYEFVESDKRDTVLIIDDASHTYQDTLAALRKFSSLVTVGSYYIVEDGIIQHLGMGRQYDGGPLRAIEEFLNSTDEYIIDRQWCDLFGKNATFNVDGYLKRIK
jgi:cephalosporin hydroxylase